MECDVAKILRAYLKENCLPHLDEIEFRDDENLFESGIIDSAGVLALIGFIENTFQIAIPDEDLLPENFKSVAAATAYINSKRRPETLDMITESPHA